MLKSHISTMGNAYYGSGASNQFIYFYNISPEYLNEVSGEAVRSVIVLSS
jgi:hypothetical protein